MRTFLDLADIMGEYELERGLAAARADALLTDREVHAVLERSPGRRGLGILRRILAREHGPALTESEAEVRFLRLIRAATLPEPEANARVGHYRVDFLWRAERMVVEIDGFRFHSGRRAFENDRERDGVLRGAGYVIERFTWRQLTERPQVVVARVALALGRAAAAR